MSGDIIGMHTGPPLVVHDSQRCAGQPCCVHNPSDHPLRDRPLNWRDDRGLMERICAHGIGHPDPDDLAHAVRLHGELVMAYRGVHGCDGCCRREAS